MLKVYLLLLLVVTSQQYSMKSDISPGKIAKLAELQPLASGEKREVFHYQKTVSIQDSNEQNELVRCDFVTVKEPEEVRESLSKIGVSEDIPINQSTMDNMLTIIKNCDAIDGKVSKKIEVTEKAEEPMDEVSEDSFFKGIVPGTKWCGLGNNAESYKDLGTFSDVDRCCRAHDLCPINLEILESRYGLTNVNVHTTSHCLCDEAFHSCLKGNVGIVDKLLSASLGQIYFKIVTKCLKGLPDIPGEKVEFAPATRKW